MRLLISSLLLALACLLAQQYFQFWSIIVLALIGGYFANIAGAKSFLIGFIAIGALWFLKAFAIDVSTDSLLTNKIASIFTLNKTSILVVTSILGGVIGGMSTLTGRLLKALLT